MSRFCLSLFTAALLLLASPSSGAQAEQKPSCWRDGGLTLCFDGKGTVSSSLYMTYDESDLEGFETTARYYGTGNTITFEVLQPEYMNDGWPWSWSKVRCRLGGPKGVMALTECIGSGRSYRDSDPVEQNGLTLTLVRSEREALCDKYETLLALPDNFDEVGHATLIDGSERSDYESADCRCRDQYPADPEYYLCEPLP
jgi:hypothetical protein